MSEHDDAGRAVAPPPRACPPPPPSSSSPPPQPAAASAKTAKSATRTNFKLFLNAILLRRPIVYASKPLVVRKYLPPRRRLQAEETWTEVSSGRGVAKRASLAWLRQLSGNPSVRHADPAAAPGDDL